MFRLVSASTADILSLPAPHGFFTLVVYRCPYCCMSMMRSSVRHELGGRLVVPDSTVDILITRVRSTPSLLFLAPWIWLYVLNVIPRP